jgi:hypothetical protein
VHLPLSRRPECVTALLRWGCDPEVDLPLAQDLAVDIDEDPVRAAVRDTLEVLSIAADDAYKIRASIPAKDSRTCLRYVAAMLDHRVCLTGVEASRSDVVVASSWRSSSRRPAEVSAAMRTLAPRIPPPTPWPVRAFLPPFPTRSAAKALQGSWLLAREGRVGQLERLLRGDPVPALAPNPSPYSDHWTPVMEACAAGQAGEIMIFIIFMNSYW